MRSSLILSLFFILPVFLTIGQISPEKEAEIDALFSEWQQGNHPGGVVGIMQGDQWVYRKAYGMANLEYAVPMTLDTRINVASITKQITAMCMVKLAQNNAISLDDDIRKYIDYLPDFGKTITIRHLLHHTSGLRSLHALLEMAGWRENDPRSVEDLTRYMSLQKELNFAPGDEHLYCNTGYIFMAQIVEKVTGERFENWCAREVLQALGMPHSFLEKDYSEIQEKRATSYLKSGSYFKQAVPFWAYNGSGNMHTTLDDLMHWYGNFIHADAGWQEAFSLMQTRGILNNGDTLNYAMGVEIDRFYGQRRIHHGGGIGGFRSFACVLPDAALRVIVMTNFSSSDPKAKVETLCKVLLPAPKSTAGPTRKTYKMKAVELRQYAGNYYNEKALFAREIRMENDTLWYVRNAQNRDFLRPVGKDLFEISMPNNNFLIKFEKSGESYDRMLVGYDAPGMGSFTRYEPVKLNETIARKAEGSWYSDELKITYEIRWENNTLFAWHPRFGKLPMHLVKEDVFEAAWPLGTLVFSETEGNYMEFKASNNRVKHLRFSRQEGE